MKTLLISTLILSISIGCNKQQLNSKKLDGEWNIVSYSRTNYEGLTSKSSYCQGRIHFRRDSSIFELNMNYIFDTSADTSIAYGSYLLEEDGSEIRFSNTFGLNLGGDGNYRILTLNNTDLQIEGGDSLGNVNTYLFSKKQ